MTKYYIEYNILFKIWGLVNIYNFLFFFKCLYAVQGCIYLIKYMVKILIYDHNLK